MHIQAIAVVLGSVATLGYMYVMGTRMKREEGKASIYSAFESLSILCRGFMIFVWLYRHQPGRCKARDPRGGE